MKTKKRTRVSKSEWLKRALDALSIEGVQGIRIERLARDLKVSKSGFYWHFKDRSDLLSQLLNYWAYEFTEVVIHFQEQQEIAPEVHLNQIEGMIRKHNLNRYDLAVRAWAEHDEKVADIVFQVYQKRLDYVRKFFKELGFKGDELEMRTYLFVCYNSWEMTTFGRTSERKLARLQKLRNKLLTR